MTDTLTPLMVDAADAGRLIGVSRATWCRMDASGRVPAPVRLSPGCVRWRVTGPLGIAAWVEAGCPRRTEWQVAEPRHE